MENKDLNNIYRSLRNGDVLRLKRDLSSGRMEEDMIQELSVKISATNRQQVYSLLFSYPILEISLEKK